MYSIEVIHLFSYIFFATSFYVSLMSNVGFRRKIKTLLKMKKSNQSRIGTVTFVHGYPTRIVQPNNR